MRLIMRNAIIALLITIVAGAARAQSAQPQPAAPDYSSEHLRQVLSTDMEDQAQSNFRVEPGAFEFHAFGADWRVAYLPILAPLHGSVPATTEVWPDAFSLN